MLLAFTIQAIVLCAIGIFLHCMRKNRLCRPIGAAVEHGVELGGILSVCASAGTVWLGVFACGNAMLGAPHNNSVACPALRSQAT